MAAPALPECYHGALSKGECEKLLAKVNRDGAYLIRNSETIKGAMCLCVYKQRKVYTYRVLKTHNQQYVVMSGDGVKEKFFSTLDELIRFYSQTDRGLATHLCHAVRRRGTQDNDSDDDYVTVLQ